MARYAFAAEVGCYQAPSDRLLDPLNYSLYLGGSCHFRVLSSPNSSLDNTITVRNKDSRRHATSLLFIYRQSVLWPLEAFFFPLGKLFQEWHTTVWMSPDQPLLSHKQFNFRHVWKVCAEVAEELVRPSFPWEQNHRFKWHRGARPEAVASLALWSSHLEYAQLKICSANQFILFFYATAPPSSSGLWTCVHSSILSSQLFCLESWAEKETDRHYPKISQWASRLDLNPGLLAPNVPF